MKVVFVDRDGVINEFLGNGLYVTKAKDFHFIPAALTGLKLLTEAGYDIFVVSNQAGVGKGVYSRRKLDLITRRMIDGVRDAGGRLAGVYYCTCRSSEGCHCRKPRIGNIIKALASIGHGLEDASQAYFVGDTEIDIKTGRNAGCTTIFALSGREDREYMKRWDVRPHLIVEDLHEAAKHIISQDPDHPRHRGRRPSQGR